LSAAVTSGVELFARYAHAPNALGFCGPSSGIGTTEPEIRAAARRFSGAWPYLQVLARLTGVDDPLDAGLVEAYWLGRDLEIDNAEFGRELLAVIGPQAGHYWSHLTPELLATGAPDHGFHVFGVYPWSRLLGRGMDAEPLKVLDSCRIRWGEVVEVADDGITVAVQHLTWDGRALGLGEQVVEVLQESHFPATDRRGSGFPATAGTLVALHWDRFCDFLTPEQAADLERSTLRELAATNLRLTVSRGRAGSRRRG
jgi:hypothetical protein